MPSRPPEMRVRLRKDNPPTLNVRAKGQHRAIHDDLYHFILTRPWWQFLALLTMTFVVVNTCFAVVYKLAPGAISNARPGSFEDAFFFSVQTLATIGYGSMAPVTRVGHVLVTIEALAGMLGVALTTGITYAKFSKPTARILFSESMVIGPRNGVPHLMFRMANWRRNNIFHASVRAYILVNERTTEGDVMRRVFDLPLVRDSNPSFVLTWSAMHEIKEGSPFFGPDALGRLRAEGAQMIVMLTGTDDTLSQQVHARHVYTMDDVIANARLSDMITLLPDGTREIDYVKMHDVEHLGDAASR